MTGLAQGLIGFHSYCRNIAITLIDPKGAQRGTQNRTVAGPAHAPMP